MIFIYYFNVSVTIRCSDSEWIKDTILTEYSTHTYIEGGNRAFRFYLSALDFVIVLSIIHTQT